MKSVSEWKEEREKHTPSRASVDGASEWTSVIVFDFLKVERFIQRRGTAAMARLLLSRSQILIGFF